MPKGISVHVGVNRVNAPGIVLDVLKGCENDAREMYHLATAQGFISDGPIVNEEATYKKVVGAILDAVPKLVSGDIFFFTFSGHGTRHGTEDIDEPDFKDETLVLHDRLLIDNVLRRILWPAFAEGVRILAISDSCYSGGVFFITDGEEMNAAVATEDEVVANGAARDRSISDGARERHFFLLKDFYTELRETIPAGTAPEIKASLLSIGACQESEKAADGDPHGVFTQALLDTNNVGNFLGSYDDLMEGIKPKIAGHSPPQHPAITSLGKPLNPEFKKQRAFSV